MVGISNTQAESEIRSAELSHQAVNDQNSTLESMHPGDTIQCGEFILPKHYTQAPDYILDQAKFEADSAKVAAALRERRAHEFVFNIKLAEKWPPTDGLESPNMNDEDLANSILEAWTKEYAIGEVFDAPDDALDDYYDGIDIWWQCRPDLCLQAQALAGPQKVKILWLTIADF